MFILKLQVYLSDYVKCADIITRLLAFLLSHRVGIDGSKHVYLLDVRGSFCLSIGIF